MYPFSPRTRSLSTKKQDVLTTCKCAPILISVHKKQGHYHIPLIQQHGQWQPRKPPTKARTALRPANSVYDLPSTEEAIKWMYAVCGYPAKSTWLKAVKAGNYMYWSLLNERNVKKTTPRQRRHTKTTGTKPGKI